ncbi:MAG: hypothetical protein Q8K63_06510 [Acidimicrobiales bacterium]|nr:hypothetical protein [Acidimicrobiales bacterium]
MGKHTEFVKGTAATLRRIADEAQANFTKAEAALTEAETASARTNQRESEEVGAIFPALRNR